jgi:hypothetical protein
LIVEYKVKYLISVISVYRVDMQYSLAQKQ